MGEDGSPLSLGSEALNLSEIRLWAAWSCCETSLLLFREKEFCCAFQWSCHWSAVFWYSLQCVPAVEVAILLRLSLFHFDCLLFLAELDDALDIPRTGSSPVLNN